MSSVSTFFKVCFILCIHKVNLCLISCFSYDHDNDYTASLLVNNFYYLNNSRAVATQIKDDVVRTCIWRNMNRLY